MLQKKVMATAMSAVLAVSLCPGLAVAAPLGAGSVDNSASTGLALSTQAKKSVYVVDSISYSYTGTDTEYKYEPAEHGNYKRVDEDEYEWVGDEDDDGYPDGNYTRTEIEVPYTSTNTYKYSYKNGLVTKVTSNYNRTGSDAYSSSSTRATLKYKGKNISKITSYGTTYKVKSKGGHIQSATYSDKWSSGSEKYSYAYTWSGSKCTKEKQTNTYKYSGQKKQTSTSTTKYSSFKKGVPTKAQASYKSSDGSSYSYAPYKYTLDSKGNVKKVKYGSNGSSSIKLAYKSGRVVTKTSGSTKYTLTYKKVKASYSAVTKAQQWSLINGNTNCAFGPVSLSA